VPFITQSHKANKKLTIKEINTTCYRSTILQWQYWLRTEFEVINADVYCKV